MAYSPKYISLDDIPVQIPDDYSQKEKQDAAELAEALIEIDLNDGDELTNASVAHQAAIKQRATCELAKAAEDPDDVALGDLTDSGQTKSNYAHKAFCNSYKKLIDTIEAKLDTETTGTFVYSTSKSQERIDWENFMEEIDVPVDDDFARDSYK